MANVVVLTVSNWESSKASGDSDGGVASLKLWLEKKAGRTIQDMQVQQGAVHIAVDPKDKARFLHLDGWTWAGTSVKVAEGQQQVPAKSSNNSNQQPRNQPISNGNPRQNGFNNRNENQNNSLASRITGGSRTNGFGSNRNPNGNSSKELFAFDPPSGPRTGFGQNPNQNNTRQNDAFSNNSQRFDNQKSNNNSNMNNNDTDALQSTLISFVHRRYNAAEKFLDFSSLAADPELAASGILQSPQRGKVWSALFKVCENKVFETIPKRNQMIETLSFKGNGITSLNEIFGAASAFVRIKNLDLSENNIPDIREMRKWQRRFPDLEQLIMTGNPADGPQMRAEAQRNYRKLRTYNMAPLDAPLNNITNLNTLPNSNGLELIPPAPTSSPAPFGNEILTNEPHPEFPAGSDFGQPTPNKPQEQLLKEQMGLKFSYQTRLKMKWVEECLVGNNWDYDKALADLEAAILAGKVPSDAFLQV